MKALCLAVLLLPALFLVTGCPPVDNNTGAIVVELRNNSEFELEVELYYDEDSDVDEDDIDNVGTRRTFTLEAGEDASFSALCLNLHAIKITNAELQTVGNPTLESDVFRIDNDFECNDQITFTFDASAIPIDFDVEFQRN